MGRATKDKRDLYYRRANQLALALGGPPEWEEKLVSRLAAANEPLAA